MRDLYTKSFVVPFYKAFLGFFSLLLLVSGVFMEYRQHVLLAERLLNSDYGVYGIGLAFVIFSFFQIRFQIGQLKDPRYRIFQNLGQLSIVAFSKVYLKIWLQNYLIIWSYTLFLTVIGIGGGNSIKVLSIWLLLLFLVSIGGLMMWRKIRLPIPDLAISPSRLIPISPFSLWYVKHLKSNRPILLLGIKAVSVFLLNGFLYSFSSGSYDLRWIQFGVICAAFIHIPIWLDKVEFEQDQLTYFRNMPRSLWKKTRSHFLNALILLFPEILLIWLKFGWSSFGPKQLVLILTWFGLNLAIFGLIQQKRDQNDWSRIAVISFFILFLLNIYSFPLLILSVFLFLVFLKGISSPFHI